MQNYGWPYIYLCVYICTDIDTYLEKGLKSMPAVKPFFFSVKDQTGNILGFSGPVTVAAAYCSCFYF